MSIVPVIGRELRSQARQPLTFLVRLAGAGAIGLAFWLAFSSLHLPSDGRLGSIVSSPASRPQDFQNFGVALFGKINLTIFVAIWLLTPLAAADSISRERREGTLALLQLTPLRPWEERGGISPILVIVGQQGIAGFFAWRIRGRLQNRLALAQVYAGFDHVAR